MKIQIGVTCACTWHFKFICGRVVKNLISDFKKIQTAFTKRKIILFVKILFSKIYTTLGEACIGILGIQDICHFTSRDIGYYPFYFQGYGILGSIFSLLPGILKI